MLMSVALREGKAGQQGDQPRWSMQSNWAGQRGIQGEPTLTGPGRQDARSTAAAGV